MSQESARICRELKQAVSGVFKGFVAKKALRGSGPLFELREIENEVLAALDRICPEEG